MTKYSFFLIFLLLLGCNKVFAQYQISKETYKISVKKFPAYYVEPAERKYFVKVINNIPESVSDSYFAPEIDLPGWEQVSDEKEAFLTLTITLPKVYSEGVNYVNKKTENFEKGGAVNIESHWYATVKYSFNAKCQLKCKFETSDIKLVPANVSPIKTYEMPENFPLQSQAKQNVIDNMNSIKQIAAQQGVKEMMVEVNKVLNEKFFSTEGYEDIQLSFLDQEGSPFYEEMVEAKQYLNQELGMIKHDVPISSAVPGVTVWIDKFKVTAGELKPSESAQKKAKEEMIKNVAILYYILEDYENATLYSQILKDSFGNREGDRIIKMRDQLQMDFEKFHKNTRHYSL